MIKECNFKQKIGNELICTIAIGKIPNWDKDDKLCLTRRNCDGESKCILYQIYKSLNPTQYCGICGKEYDEEFNWDNYIGEINFYMSSIKPPLHRKCYEKYCKDIGYDG